MRKPELVAKEIHEQANQYEEKPARRKPPPRPPAPAPRPRAREPAASATRTCSSLVGSGDATEQLAKLHDLLTRGAITQVEYDAKKAELLNRL